jgi:hypothetical protein
MTKDFCRTKVLKLLNGAFYLFKIQTAERPNSDLRSTFK